MFYNGAKWANISTIRCSTIRAYAPVDEQISCSDGTKHLLQRLDLHFVIQDSLQTNCLFWKRSHLPPFSSMVNILKVQAFVTSSGNACLVHPTVAWKDHSSPYLPDI